MNSDKRKGRVVMVGQTPPPYHGQAVATEILFRHGWSRIEVETERMAYSDSSHEVGRFRLGKVIHLFVLWWRVVRRLGWSRDALLYYPPASAAFVPVVRDIAFLMLARPFARGVVFHYHAGGLTAYLQDKRVLGLLARLAYGRPLMCIEIASSEASRPGDLFGAQAQLIVRNGLDVPTALLDTAGEGAGVPVVLFMAGLEESKGVFDVLETARLLKQAGREVGFRIAGSWRHEAERELAELFVTEHGLSGYVTFLGLVTGEEKWQVYRSADVFFFPSFYESENFPLVLIEAMACGLPVVSTKWRGIPEIVEDGVTGHLREVRDTLGFAECLKQLTDDPVAMEEMGGRALERYRGQFTEQVFCEAMEEALCEAWELSES